MDEYDGLQQGSGTYTVRVHLQDGKYKGYFDKKIHGYCKGVRALDFDFSNPEPEDFQHFKMHNLEIKPMGPNFDDWWFHVKIYDDDNHTDWVEGDFEAVDLNAMVVGIEIVDYKKGAEKWG